MLLSRLFFGSMALLSGMVLVEAIFFGLILAGANSTGDADAIVVFQGATSRTKTGIALQRAGVAPKLVISSAKRRHLAGLPLPVQKSLIIEDQARTTFENALYTRHIVARHGIHSVLLVTSDYHAPRSYFLLKSLLMGQGVHVGVYKVPASGKVSIFPPKNIRSLKILYNEMVKLWGSLGEAAAYGIRGKVPERSPKANKVLRVMKRFLLFEV